MGEIYVVVLFYRFDLEFRVHNGLSTDGYSWFGGSLVLQVRTLNF